MASTEVKKSNHSPKRVNLNKENRHCEARSAVAIQKMLDFHWIATEAKAHSR
jgi:hypothetical protein